MVCPKCGFSQADSNVECDRCGVIFSKIGIVPAPAAESKPGGRARTEARTTAPRVQASQTGPGRVHEESARHAEARNRGKSPGAGAVAGASASGTRRLTSARSKDSRDELDLYEKPASIDYLQEELDLDPEPRHMDRDDWIVLGAGVVIALGVTLFPLLNHIFMTLVVLVHEMGHTIVGWIFAYPSVPAFDLHYGGGLTLHTHRSTILLLVIYLSMGFLIYTYRKNVPTLILLSCVLIVHLVFSLTYFHEVVILFMGHGTELVIAAIFFYRALSGAAVVHSVERPLYCAIGLFIVFSDIRFAYRLMTSHSARHQYEQAKGGGHWMDFSRIGEDFLGVDLTSVAFFFFLCCLLTLVVGFLTFRYQEYIRRLILRLWTREPLESRR